MVEEEKNKKYLISYCTKSQFLKILGILAETSGDNVEINMLVGDRDSHHQRKVAVELGVIEKKNGIYEITELGRKLASAYDLDEDEFARILREECLSRIPFFDSMMKLAKTRRRLSRDDLIRSIATLVGKRKRDSTYNSYAGMAIGYLELAGVIEYDKRKKEIIYVLQ